MARARTRGVTFLLAYFGPSILFAPLPPHHVEDVSYFCLRELNEHPLVKAVYTPFKHVIWFTAPLTLVFRRAGQPGAPRPARR